MLYMIIEHFHEGKAPEIYQRFREQGRMAPEGVVYVSSWVDYGFRRCFQVMEAESEVQLQAWMRHWDDLVTFEVVPVYTSAEAAQKVASPN